MQGQLTVCYLFNGWNEVDGDVNGELMATKLQLKLVKSLPKAQT